LIFELIYRSVMSTDASPSCVADIVRASRGYNQQHGITGLLVFDGEKFWQLLEGDCDAVVALTNRIERDTRHRDFHITHQGFRDSRRRFGNWSMAYALDTSGEFAQAWDRSTDPELASLIEQGAMKLDIDKALEL